MTKARKETEAATLANDLGVYNEGDAVHAITTILSGLDDNKSIIRVMHAVAALFDRAFWIETS